MSTPKAHQLHQDIVHDSELNNGLTFLDTRIFEFYDWDTGKPLKLVQYKAHDGALRCWLVPAQWDDTSLKAKMLEEAV